MDETNETDGTNLRDAIKEDRVTGQGTRLKDRRMRKRERQMILKGRRAVGRVVVKVKMIA